VLGALTLINTFFGCIGSCYKRSLLTLYLIIGTVLTVAQACGLRTTAAAALQ
jgi:hypothetical protein